MPEYEKIENLISRYERSSVIRALVQLVPFGMGSAIDTAVITRVKSIREERLSVFFDDLESGSRELSPELLENNEFLHCFFATSSAVLKTRRKEKILFFSKLILSSTVDGKISDVDEYEEYLKILDDISYREIVILNMLSELEINNPCRQGENDLQCAMRYWGVFIEKIIEKFQIPLEEIDALLTRLSRSGCYETFVGGYYGHTGGKGKTTPTFKRLKELALK